MDLIDTNLKEKLMEMILVQKEEEDEVEEMYYIIIDQVVMFTITNTKDQPHIAAIEEVEYMIACVIKNSNKIMKEAILHFSVEVVDHFKITILIGHIIIIITKSKMKMAGILINRSIVKIQKKSMIVLKVNIKVVIMMDQK